MTPRIVFGATEFEVSPVCFGTWQLSPRFWGTLPEADVLAAMRAAVDAGVNFFDTADAYGDGYAETVLGRFLAEVRRDDVVVATKVFNHFNPDASRYPDLQPHHLRERCDIELRRLGLDTIDLYLLHGFDPLTPLPDVTETLEALKAAGKIRHYGVSNFTLEQFRAARALGEYQAVQPPYSLLAPGIERDLLPYCQAENVAVMVYSPLHKGLLTGKYRGDETFSDFRREHPDFQGDRFRELATAVQRLGDLAAKYALSICQLVLTVTLMHPAIQVAIVGIKRPEQIREAAQVMGKAIDREDYFAVRRILAGDSPDRIRDARGVAR